MDEVLKLKKELSKTRGELNKCIRELKGLAYRFEEEKRCKNEAYYFILSRELLEQYRLFLKYRDRGCDAFASCREFLEERAFRERLSRGEI